ncbi:histidine kinase [Streptomyces sp. NPDC088729]|uniref:histidine kinase n=1 Tax=Streptomyces sp. NPDC088729 TaxID=3365876 RepID=UPI003808CB04
MPSYDITRPRFRLSDEHVIVLTELATGQPVPTEYRSAERELQQCGLVSEAGTLSVLLLPVMQTIINPVVVISLEATGRQGTLNHGLMIGQDYVIAHQSWPTEREAEYTMVEPRMMVWAIANMVNLQRSAIFDHAGPGLVETTMRNLEEGLLGVAGFPLDVSAEEERAHIRASLESTGTMADPELSLFADMIGELRSSWRVTAAWRSHRGVENGVTVRSFGVWDCGPLGYWHRELPAEPLEPGRVGPDSTVRLIRTDAKRIWAMLTDLLPADSEIRRAGP